MARSDLQGSSRYFKIFLPRNGSAKCRIVASPYFFGPRTLLEITLVVGMELRGL